MGFLSGISHVASRVAHSAGHAIHKGEKAIHKGEKSLEHAGRHAVKATGKGIDHLGKDIEKGAGKAQHDVHKAGDWANHEADHGVDRFERSSLGKTAAGKALGGAFKAAVHFSTGEAEGVSSTATGTFSLFGTSLRAQGGLLRSTVDPKYAASVRHSVGHTASAIGEHPGAVLKGFGKSIGHAWNEDGSANFLGQVGGVVAGTVAGAGLTGAAGAAGDAADAGSAAADAADAAAEAAAKEAADDGGSFVRDSATSLGQAGVQQIGGEIQQPPGSMSTSLFAGGSSSYGGFDYIG